MTTALKTLLEAAADTDGAWEIEQAGDTKPDGFVRNEAKPIFSVSLYNAEIADRDAAGEVATKELILVLPSVLLANFDIEYEDIFPKPYIDDSVESAVYLNVTIDREGLEAEVTGSIIFSTKASECGVCDGRGSVLGGKPYYGRDGEHPRYESCEACWGDGEFAKQEVDVEIALDPTPALNPETGEWQHDKTSDYEWKVMEPRLNRRR